MKTLIGTILTLVAFPVVVLVLVLVLLLAIAECAVRGTIRWVKEMPYR